MAKLTFQRRFGEFLMTNDETLTIWFNKAPIKPNHNMNEVIPCEEARIPLHFLLRDLSGQNQDTGTHKNLYLHMRQKEAMYIWLDSFTPYLMRIYVDGVNVVTGRTTQEQGEQDYFVLPDQEYVNGYKPNPRAPLMQFCCPPLVQADATRRDCRTIRFEITPYIDVRYWAPRLTDSHHEHERTTLALPHTTVKDLRTRYELHFEGARPVSTRLVYEGKQLEDDSLVADHLFGTGDLVEVAVPGKPRRKPRLLKPDTYPAFGWEPSRTTIFNVHMLNSKGACELFANCRPDSVDEEEERMYGVTGTGISGCLVQFDPEPASTKPLMPFRTAAQPVHPENRDTIS